MGLGLMLGLFTQLACAGALALLALFYVSWFPTRGVYEPGAEGNYLLVNKNLVEAAAVAVVLLFRTGRIAGLDLLRGRERVRARSPCRPSRRQLDEPHPGAAGARAPQLPASPFRDARARGARRRRRREGPGARRSRAPRLHRPRRPGARAARADRPALRGGRGRLRHQPASAPEDRRVARQDLAPAGQALRRLEGDDPEGEARGRRDRLAAVHAHGRRGRLHGGGPARAVREDDGHGRRVLPPHGGRRQAHGPRARDRPPALLQPGLPGVLRRHRQGRPARRRVPRAARVAPERQLAPHGRAAVARLQPGAVGLPDLRPPDQLAALQAVLARPHGRAREPPGRDRRLVLRRPGQRGHRQRRRLPLQGRRPRGARPHLRDARVPGRARRRLHLDRVERLRQLLRGVLRHEGHADPAGRGRGLPVRGGRARPARVEGDRSRRRVQGGSVRAPRRRAAPPTPRARARAWARPRAASIAWCPTGWR